MIKKIFTLSLTFMFLSLFSQNYPEKNPELLVNHIVKPKVIAEVLQQYAYKNFYLEFDKEKKQIIDETKKPFATGPSYSLKSDYSKLVGKEFKVIQVYPITPKFSFSTEKFAVEMENPEIGKVFYQYDAKYEHDFELEVVGGITYPEGFLCSKVQYQKDKFENKETYFTPTEDGISFMKVVENGKKTIYLSIDVYGSTLNVGEKGINILFENGKKFSKPEAKIDTDVRSGSGYTYSGFIALTPTEIKTFSENNITDTRLYIYDSTVDNESAKKIKEYLNCLNK